MSGESHEQRSLAGYSPWGLKKSDITEHARTPGFPATRYVSAHLNGRKYTNSKATITEFLHMNVSDRMPVTQ